MSRTPPFDSILAGEYRKAPDNLRRVRILHEDFRKQPEVKEYRAARRNSESARRLEAWAPLKRIGGPEFAVAVGDAVDGKGRPSGVSGYAFGHGPPQFWSQLWFRAGFVLMVTGGLAVVLSILRGVRSSMIQYSATEMASVIRALGVWDPTRLERFGWLVPDIVLGARPVPILSFLSYSPAVLLGAVMFSVFFPGRKLPVLLASSLAITVAVSVIAGLASIFHEVLIPA